MGGLFQAAIVQGSRRRRFDADADAEPGKTAGDGRGGGKSGGTRSHHHAKLVAESRLALLEARSRQFSRNLQLRSREIDENAGEVGELGTRLLQLEKTVELCRGELEMLRLEVVEVKEHCQRGGGGGGNAEPQAERAEQKERLGVPFEQRKPALRGSRRISRGLPRRRLRRP